MLTHRVRNIVAAIVLGITMATCAVWAWHWAEDSLAAWDAAAPTRQVAASLQQRLEVSGLSIDLTNIGVDWVDAPAQMMGIDEETAEKATVGLYGALVGLVVGGVLAFVFSEPIARVLTAWPNHRKRAKLVV